VPVSSASCSDDVDLVGIVLVNWNGWRDTAACLESCAGLTYPRVTCFVVDNGSTDESVTRLRERFPHVRLIETGANLGFAGGVNAGMHAALAQGAGYVWLLNNDTIVDADALSALVEAMEAFPSVGIAGSRIDFFDRPKTLWFAGGFVSRVWAWTVHRGLGEPDTGQYGWLEDVDFVTGCSLFVRARAAMALGPMDERFFLYWEDVEWCVRAVRAGWRVVYVPSSLIWHKISASAPDADGRQRWRYEGRNRLLFYRTQRPAALPQVVCSSLLNAAYLAFRGRPMAGLGLIEGMIAAIRGVSGALPPEREARNRSRPG
jgi:GT2 family glycosyltransferase